MKKVEWKRLYHGNNMIRFQLVILFSIWFTSSISSQEVFDINVAKTVKEIPANPTGLVSCWLMDSDENRPRNKTNVQAFKEMGVKMIRFPYGHLSNNYLWTIPPFADAINGLKPRVGSLHEDPALWDWAVDTVTGAFKKAMDFDEFINMCNDVGAEPFVCVNVLSYKYQDGPSYEALKKSAVEWVKYANITKNYDVKYWMLGNEQDLHEGLLSKTEYISLYKDFATAMKEIDSSIILAPAVLYQQDWFEDVLDSCYQYIDFMTTQQYLWGASWTSGGYSTWKEFEGVHLPFVETLLSALNASPKPDMDVYITETGATPPSGWPDGTQNDLYRSLCWFDQCMGQLKTEKVQGNLYWNTHSPWQGEFGDGDLRNALTNDSVNRRKPTGEIIKIVNNNINTEFVQANRVSGYLRNYTTYSPANNELTIFLLNKDNQQVETKIYLHNLSAPVSYTKWVYTGTSPYDTLPVFSQKGTVTLSDSCFSTILDSVSLSIIKLQDVSRLGEPLPPFGKYIWLKSFITGKYTTVSANNIQANADTVTDSSQMFYIEDAGNGYVRLKTLAGQGGYIETQSNSTDYLQADGTSTDADQWKWKHVYENGVEYVVLESKTHEGQHARVNNNDTEKRLDASGGTAEWARFSFGLALSDKNQIISTDYGVLDSINKQIAVHDSIFVSDFKAGLILSAKAVAEVVYSSQPDAVPVSGQDTTFVDTTMVVQVMAEDSSINTYSIRFLNKNNSILETFIGRLDTTRQLLIIPDTVSVVELKNALSIPMGAVVKIMSSSNADANSVHDSEIVDSNMYAWITAENGKVRKYAIEIEENLYLSLLDDMIEHDIMFYQPSGFDIIVINSPVNISSLRIYNLQGKLMMHERLNAKNVHVDVSTLNQGIYFVEFISEDGRRTVKKMIKQ